MLVGLSGPTAYFEPGDPYECDEAEAARLIGARFAVPWIETTSLTPVAETREAKTRKRKGE